MRIMPHDLIKNPQVSTGCLAPKKQPKEKPKRKRPKRRGRIDWRRVAVYSPYFTSKQLSEVTGIKRATIQRAKNRGDIEVKFETWGVMTKKVAKLMGEGLDVAGIARSIDRSYCCAKYHVNKVRERQNESR